MFRSSELVKHQAKINSLQLKFDRPTIVSKSQATASMSDGTIKPYVEIGARLKAARKALGLNQKVFAAKANLSASQVSNWESGLNRPSLDNCIVLRETFGLSIDFIVFGNLDALPHRIAKLLEDNPRVINSK